MWPLASPVHVACPKTLTLLLDSLHINHLLAGAATNAPVAGRRWAGRAHRCHRSLMSSPSSLGIKPLMLLSFKFLPVHARDQLERYDMILYPCVLPLLCMLEGYRRHDSSEVRGRGAGAVHGWCNWPSHAYSWWSSLVSRPSSLGTKPLILL